MAASRKKHIKGAGCIVVDAPPELTPREEREWKRWLKHLGEVLPPADKPKRAGRPTPDEKIIAELNRMMGGGVELIRDPPEKIVTPDPMSAEQAGQIIAKLGEIADLLRALPGEVIRCAGFGVAKR